MNLILKRLEGGSAAPNVKMLVVAFNSAKYGFQIMEMNYGNENLHLRPRKPHQLRLPRKKIL